MKLPFETLSPAWQTNRLRISSFLSSTLQLKPKRRSVKTLCTSPNHKIQRKLELTTKCYPNSIQQTKKCVTVLFQQELLYVANRFLDQGTGVSYLTYKKANVTIFLFFRDLRTYVWLFFYKRWKHLLSTKNLVQRHIRISPPMNSLLPLLSYTHSFYLLILRSIQGKTMDMGIGTGKNPVGENSASEEDSVRGGPMYIYKDSWQWQKKSTHSLGIFNCWNTYKTILVGHLNSWHSWKKQLLINICFLDLTILH